MIPVTFATLRNSHTGMKDLPRFIFFLIITASLSCTNPQTRHMVRFSSSWRFHFGDLENAHKPSFNDSSWRSLNLPHEWSIEGEFSPGHPATAGGGALPGGIGWYRKSFTMNEEQQGKLAFIEFDGVYMNSEVWINGHYLGKRPNGYISFRYELTPHLQYGDKQNVIAVRVDNSLQPNSRWYSGSGIYRNVRLVLTDPVHVDQWGTVVTTSEVSDSSATVCIKTSIKNGDMLDHETELLTTVYDPDGKKVAAVSASKIVDSGTVITFVQELKIDKPRRWSVDQPVLYKAVSQVKYKGKIRDVNETSFGIRSIHFDEKMGFVLNGKQVKIRGVCNHHDLGCLGAAVNKRAIERQLEILKAMGVNAIRTAHNPPAPELLDLCDRMGFVVMDEMFDMWKKKKSPYDYSMYWDEWHQRDLEDFIKRDRNHPSVFIWSVGNEILEQWDTTGIEMVKYLVAATKQLDNTRPVTVACNPPSPYNNLIKPGVVDLIGYNYAHGDYEKFPQIFPGQKFIATETTSALATRGHYDMPSDTVKRWPVRWDLPFTQGNTDNTVSAYDHVSAPWGSTHEETWKIIRKHDYLSGMFIWTGFDYLGEPTPYGWPSRSSYFGVIDLAGFPKDVYYMYQSEWTDKPVLHIFPHWNWNLGEEVDVWAYFNTEEVELFLNNKSLGVKRKSGDDLHVMWRVPFEPGTLRAVARSGGKEILTKEIKTAGYPAKIELIVDRNRIKAGGEDLAFVTVNILDKNGNMVPTAENLVKFAIRGDASIAGVDNGDQTSHEPFKADYRKAFNGKCLAVVRSGSSKGLIDFTATSEGLEPATANIEIYE